MLDIKSLVQKFRERFFYLSVESKGFHYRLPIIFSLFFLFPVSGFLYFVVQYGIFKDKYYNLFIIAFLVSSAIGYIMIRKIIYEIRDTSNNISENIVKDISGCSKPSVTNELHSIIHSFKTLENELRTSFGNLDKKVSQISILKELSDLCYVTFDTEDLLYITLERALMLVNADVGSVLLLDDPEKRNYFTIHATIGLDRIKKGDRINFTTSIAKFAVINKSPLIVEDIETDNRFGRANLEHYGTKSFLCMPLKGINEVLGVLTLSRKKIDFPFTKEDSDILSPLLSGMAFTYDNLALTKKLGEKTLQLITMENLIRTINSSLGVHELTHVFLNQIKSIIPYDLATILLIDEKAKDQVYIFDFLAFIPTNLSHNTTYRHAGSTVDKVTQQGVSLYIEDTPTKMNHIIERELWGNHCLQSCVISPLKTKEQVIGVLFLGSLTPETFKNKNIQKQIDAMNDIISIGIEKEKLSFAVVKLDKEMDLIKQIGSLLASSTFDMNDVIKHTLNMIQAIINVEAGSLLILEGDELRFKGVFNKIVPAEKIQDSRIKLGQGIAGYTAARGESLLINDVKNSRFFYPAVDQSTGFVTQSVLCVPLISQGKVFGVIEVINKVGGDFDDNDLHLIQSIATTVSIAMENSRLYQETLSMAEHERSIRNMFQKFVPKEIVDKITHHTSGEKPLVEELKILTLLNIDIRGFSHLSHKLGPKKTVSMLNHFFSTMGEIIFKYNGIVDKYLGDGFLALFGAPITGTTDADNAISAALEMRKSLAACDDYLAIEGIDTPLAMGISIHTGEVVVGNIGFDKKMDYTVIGGSVNVVFRLQELAKTHPNIILISEKTRRAAVNPPLQIREFGTFNVGDTADEALKIYELEPQNS
jgi:adenylate cyclase